MNSHAEIASERGPSERRPFPPTQYPKVLVVGRNSDSINNYHRMREAWHWWAGECIFNPDEGGWTVGILLKGCDMAEESQCEFITLLEKGGDVFEYCPVRQNFRRLDLETFRLFYVGV